MVPQNLRKWRQEKNQFRSQYCARCRQRKVCGELDAKKKYCCVCKIGFYFELLAEGYGLTEPAQKALGEWRGGKRCKCRESQEPRAKHYWPNGYGYNYCEGCEKRLEGAGKTGEMKNRNNPAFWGLAAKEKILCLECVENYRGQLTRERRKVLSKYLKRGYV